MKTLVTAGSAVPAGFIQIPHAVVRGSYSDRAVLVYAALANHPGDHAGWIRKPHEHLARYLGWANTEVKLESATKRVARGLRELIDGGVVRRRMIREGEHLVPIYRVTPIPNGAPFEALPRHLFAAATSSGMSRTGATLVRHWLRWRVLAGAAGWTRPELRKLVKTFRLTEKKAAERLQQLLDAGWIRLVKGVGGDTLRFTTSDPTQDFNQGSEALQPSVHQAPAEAADQVSAPSPTKCPPSSTHHASHQPSNDPSVVASAATVQSVEGPAPTADKPPTKTKDGREKHHQNACRIVNAQPLLAGRSMTTVRLKAIAMLTKRLRKAATHDRPIDVHLASAYIADRLEQAHQDDALETNHCQLIREALANLRADTLAGHHQPEEPCSAPTGHDEDTTTPPTITVPDGPQLEDLAALPIPTRRQAAADPSVAVDAVSRDLARWLLDQLERDPDLDVDEALNLAQRRLTSALTGTPYAIAIQFAPGLVRRAYDRSVLQQQADELADLDELRRIHALAVASLEMAGAAA
ncbi:MAG: hypothetical protein L0G49_02050 [Luteococcus sp.]|uniref:hypothetical protein n=1 Tax=Luteococcus sp. TaxID=1969402 RepID=UPI002647AB22|nr:hypothetical protein [Luteococcus sp.]MDN5562551.1 hypothetical protein [Luteococcus sp.]